MAKTKKINIAGKFGVRYGRKVKARYIEIEKKQRGWHNCPYCKSKRVKRIAKGIWQCRKCNTKFTGRAYTPK